MSFVDFIVRKNNVKLVKWPELPKAFSCNTMQDVIRRLKEEGWDVFGAQVEGLDVYMARFETSEIYFDGNIAILASSDYGCFQGKIFRDLNIHGNYKALDKPERYWCNIA